MSRGFTRDDMSEWLPYPDRPEGSDARIKPSSVPAYWNMMADGKRRLIPQNYVCTIFRRDDPVVAWLLGRLPRPSEIPWENVSSWRPDPKKVREKTVPRLKLVGRLCAKTKYETDAEVWNSYMKNGTTPLGGAVRIDVYIGVYSICPEEDAIRRAERKKAAALAKIRAPAGDDDGVLGVRSWDLAPSGRLQSRYGNFVWTSSRMRADEFSLSDVVHGERGIHAHRMPRDPEAWAQSMTEPHDEYYGCIHGIVERFGGYVLGDLGWRAEEVQIKKLWARTPEEAAVLTSRYPDVEVVVLRKVEV